MPEFRRVEITNEAQYWDRGHLRPVNRCILKFLGIVSLVATLGLATSVAFQWVWWVRLPPFLTLAVMTGSLLLAGSIKALAMGFDKPKNESLSPKQHERTVRWLLSGSVEEGLVPFSNGDFPVRIGYNHHRLNIPLLIRNGYVSVDEGRELYKLSGFFIEQTRLRSGMSYFVHRIIPREIKSRWAALQRSFAHRPLLDCNDTTSLLTESPQRRADV